jgi:hypothetical protein
MTRIIDNLSDDTSCPVCGASKELIKVVDPSRPTYLVCTSCGYDESNTAKFPSHET